MALIASAYDSGYFTRSSDDGLIDDVFVQFVVIEVDSTCEIVSTCPTCPMSTGSVMVYLDAAFELFATIV
jgi:hypothetical protein